MSRFVTITAIAASYFVFAILLNSVGTVILQSINSFGISKPEASVLEGFKDLSIALVSFFVASVIPRFGYKLALVAGLISVTVACLVTAAAGNFLIIKLLFATIGASFALVKVAVYAIIGQLTKTTDEHSSLLNTIEGIFMLGSLSGYWLFSFYIDGSADGWLAVYLPLAGIALLALICVVFAPIEKPLKAQHQSSVSDDFVAMLKMSYQPLVLVFILSIFLYVLIEQGIGSWLPTFNNEVLNLPADVSVQMTSIFAASLAAGRLLAGQILKHVNWYVFLNLCVVAMALLIALTLPLTANVATELVTSVLDAPLVAYMLPLVGLMMAPIYPVLNSVILSRIERSRQAAMTGLIVVFSALGGTTGSVVTGFLFDSMGGQNAFYLSLLPCGLILLCLYLLRQSTGKSTMAAVS